MTPRANWKGYLRFSLVSCPILLYPASEAEKVHFHQLNKATGNRIHVQKVDAETDEVVPAEDIIKGYEVGKGKGYVEITDEDLEALDIESTRTIGIDQFVPRDEIDDLYIDRPYYIVPDGKVGQQAFAVIREAIKKRGMVGQGDPFTENHVANPTLKLAVYCPRSAVGIVTSIVLLCGSSSSSIRGSRSS
jgi:DNA end-binding protein Ku